MSTAQRTALHVAATLLLLLIIAPLQAQDFDPDRDLTRYSTSATAQRGMLKRPEVQKQFILGFNWGHIPEDSTVFKALRMNVLHELTGITSDTSKASYKTLTKWVPSDMGLIHANTIISHDSPTPYAWSTSMQFDPVVANRGSAHEFTERLGDTTGATWGFKFRDLQAGKVLDEDPANVTDENYGRILLRDSTFRRVNGEGGRDSAAPRLVLAQPNPDILRARDELDGFRALYDRDMQYPDNLQTHNSSEMFIRDSRVGGWYLLQFDRYKRSSTGTIVVDGNGVPVVERVFANGETTYWMDNAMRGGDTTVIYMKGDSTEWWLAANLRRLVNPDQNNLPPNTVVMSLRVPMVVRYDTVHFDKRAQRVKTIVGLTRDTVYARFDSTCVAGDTVYHPHYGYMDKTLAAYNDTVFYIRAGMLLPPEHTVGLRPRPDITLSAHFWLPRFAEQSRYSAIKPETVGDGGVLIPSVVSYYDTVALRGYPRTVVMPVVERVQMDVTYHGNVDIALDWLRYETRLSRMILRGYKDSSIIGLGRQWYNHMDNIAGHRNLWLYGFYLMDEADPVYWRTHRYMSRLLEDIGTTETGWDFRGQYRHQARDRHHWISWLGMNGEVPAPYIRYGKGNNYDTTAAATYLSRPDRSMNIFGGYSGVRHLSGTNDVKTPYSFEVGRPNFNGTGSDGLLNGSWFTLSDSLYQYALKAGRLRSVQAALEFGMEERVLNNRELLYGNLPVWYNSWTFSEYKVLPNKYYDNSQYPQIAAWHFGRPHTAEEVRVVNWLALALGGKGLMPYKGGSSFNSSKGEPIGQYGFTSYPSVNGSSGRYLPPQGPGTNGGDFFDSLDVVWTHTNIDSVAWFTEVPKSRFYAGRVSTYDELVRVHNFAADNGPELMKLQLQAVYSKGYRLATSTRNSSINIGNYLDTTTVNNTSKFAVRPIHTATGNGSQLGEEPFRDEAFFMVTLLKDSAKSLDEVMYFGIVNRRTDPTVYYPFAGGTELGGGRKFFATNEFNALVTTGSLNYYTHPEYAQAGSRSITLPLKLGHLLADNDFSLVRIKDVGGTLDTIIPENALPSSGLLAMSFRFKPGEGKLIRVSILHPGTIPEGELAYTNQRKMVCIPDAADTTKVRYYMVYHRWEQTHHEVYYRYSRPTTRVSDEANIVWEAEEPLSMVVHKLLPDGKKEWFYDLNCAYPSLVVRPAEWGKQRVYVVFGCEHPDEKTQEQWIVENNFTPVAPPVPLPAPRSPGDVIATAQGRSLADWGTPVISAVERGNIYAWADSVEGIVLGFKPSIVDTLTDTRTIRWSQSSDSAQHPSLASYTRYSIGENSTALVWQEDEKIYYASPYIAPDSTLHLHHLPVFDPNSTNWLPHNADTTILNLCYRLCPAKNRLPVVYRSVEPMGESGVLYSLDRIAWEGKLPSVQTGTPFWHIQARWIDLYADTTQTNRPYLWFERSPDVSVYSPQYNLAQADLAQGALRTSAGTPVNTSDSAFTMSFISWFGVGAPSAPMAKVWHWPFSYRYSGQTIDVVGSQQNHVIAQQGLHPHLAARQSVETGNWWRNRRMFEFGTKPQILPSAQYYYRSPTVRSEYSMTKVMAMKKDCGAGIGIFEPVYTDIHDIPIVMKPKSVTGAYRVDTLISDAFPIGGSTEVSFYVTGTDTTLARVELVNTHTGTRSTIPLTPATHTTATLVAQTFTNGGGYLYRLEYIKKLSQAEYTVDLLAGKIPLQNTSGTIIGYAKSADEDRSDRSGRIANLAISGTEETPGLHAYVYPNPAQDVVSISVYRTYAENMAVTGNREAEQLFVRIVSMLGTEVARFNVSTGADISLPVKALPKGVYFVRVEQVGNPAESGTTSFVVE